MQSVKSLFSLSCENIRKNWTEYSATITPETTEYELLWRDLLNKHEISCDDRIVVLLKRFIEDTGKSELLMKKLDKETRASIHLLCDKLGLWHQSKGSKFNRILRVYKPVVWLWEFTATNPTTYKGKTEKTEKTYREKRDEYAATLRNAESLEKYYCYSCDRDGGNVELCCSPYYSMLLCLECLEITSDGDGSPMSCHKWEGFEP
jgi:hypothetical protein